MFRTFALFSMLFLLVAGVALAQDELNGNGYGQGSGVCGFVDEDGDGFNDLAPDADGDGIPNGLDPDYVRPEDGTGSQVQHQFGKLAEGELAKSFGAVMDAAAGAMHKHAYKYAFAGEDAGFAWGPGDGSGLGTGPADGTGFGPGDGTGDCDGSGSPADAVQARRGERR